MSQENVTPSESDVDSVLKSKSNDNNQEISSTKRFHNDKLMITTLIIASLITVLIYAVPDWVFIEIPTRNIISDILSIIGIENFHIPNSTPNSVIPEYLRGGNFPFIEATTLTPGIHIPSTNGDYWIVKADASRWVTYCYHSSYRSYLDCKTPCEFSIICSIVYWKYATNHISSMVCFLFGTILFAMIIEKMGVPLIDQFADWLDWIWWRIDKLISSFT
ncbi:MAG: hypothetical protein ACXADW_24625 [Candidatus Hodarchaeales archaeon]|jgi:hypothetical protein